MKALRKAIQNIITEINNGVIQPLDENFERYLYKLMWPSLVLFTDQSGNHVSSLRAEKANTSEHDNSAVDLKSDHLMLGQSSKERSSETSPCPHFIMIDDSPDEALAYMNAGYTIVELLSANDESIQFSRLDLFESYRYDEKKQKSKRSVIAKPSRTIDIDELVTIEKLFFKVARPPREITLGATPVSGIFRGSFPLSDEILKVIRTKRHNGEIVKVDLDYDLAASAISTDEHILVTPSIVKESHTKYGYNLAEMQNEALKRLAFIRECHPRILTANTKLNVMLRHLIDCLLAKDESAMKEAANINVVSLKGNVLPLSAEIIKALKLTSEFQSAKRTSFLNFSAGLRLDAKFDHVKSGISLGKPVPSALCNNIVLSNQDVLNCLLDPTNHPGLHSVLQRLILSSRHRNPASLFTERPTKLDDRRSYNEQEKAACN